LSRRALETPRDMTRFASNGLVTASQRKADRCVVETASRSRRNARVERAIEALSITWSNANDERRQRDHQGQRRRPHHRR
jgi:hypothetical protein